ncbi:N-acetylmuramoyl-L-alanine amidase [Streptomyces galilaeus]|uniref:N-acetylmuramoyl-L-alanine amidase n=1 Tax=Streptomyces galilaeus TaxID=33899 RepID=UPI0038F780E4
MALKLVTRSQWGARAYRTPNGATPYSRPRRGVKLHYLGTPYTDRTHDRCDDYVRQLQAQHMDGNGWSDIGYSFLVCTHGYVYEGRGLKRRNSANGSTTLNDQDYAVCLLVGSSELTKPTSAQLDGTRDAIEYCRTSGPAGTWLGGHRDGYATACPGDVVYAWVKAGAPRPASATPAPTAPTPTAPKPTQEADVPTVIDESNALDVQLESGKWLPLAFADEGALLAGPVPALAIDVHLYFDVATTADTKIQGVFYLTNTDGTGASNYLVIDHKGGGGHQFHHSHPIPAGKKLWFQVRAISPDGTPVTLLHRVASGLHWS